MSQFKHNQQQNGNGNVEKQISKQADYLTDGPKDWAAITQQWMLKTEKYSNDASIPPAPLPPNIAYLCYFDEGVPDVPNVNNDREERTRRLLSAESTNFARNRNDCQPLNPVKIEPDDARRTWSGRYSSGVENPINASRPESISQPPLSQVKVEPEEMPVTPTESNLYCGAPYVASPKNRENVSCRENINESHNRPGLNSVKIEPEQATETLLRNNIPTVGYNVYIENPRNGILGSSYQPISNDMSSESNHSEYWLPILSRLEDWPSIKDEFLSAVERVSAGIHFYGSEPEAVFKVCASLMNSAVVKIMENGNNELDNSAFINGFFSIYRILNRYAQDEKELIELSNRALTNFVSSPAARVKRAVPNLGEFLMHLTVSTQWTWSQIAKVFMDEVDTRNVFWYCVGNHNSPPAHPELIDVYQYGRNREAKVFHATTVSRNLVMFQVKFANMTKSMEFSEFCTNFRRVQDILTSKLKNLYRTVIAIKNWDQFYDFLQMPRVSLEKRNSDLSVAVTRSAAQGYHKRPASAMRRGSGSKKRRMR